MLKRKNQLNNDGLVDLLGKSEENAMLSKALDEYKAEESSYEFL